MMLGAHLIRSYSKTQSVVAKSFGESELYALDRASTEGLGILRLLKDFGTHDGKVRVGMDASAAIGMAQRTGLNKVRHVEVDILWIQEQAARRILPIAKIPGPQNPSDLCTKNVGVALMEQYLSQLHTEFAAGRAAVAQQLHRLAQRGLAIAAPEVGDLFIGVIGGQTKDQVCASPCDGAQLPGVIGGLVRPESGKKVKVRSAEERGVDSWESAGKRAYGDRRTARPEERCLRRIA